MASVKWSNQKRKINDLLPYAKNPRKMTEEQEKMLRDSLEKFDLVEIPAINLDNTILAGHQRLRILQSLGRGDEEIDVRVPDRQLTEEEVAEYNIRSNKNVGDWDFDALAEFDQDMLASVGFDSETLEDIFDLKAEEDEFEENPETKQEDFCKLGDVFLLGQHKLICGDSTDPKYYELLMGSERANLVFTDPPYMVDYESSAGNSYSKGKFGSNQIFNDNLSDEKALEFYIKVLKNLHAYTTADAPIYWWHAMKNHVINYQSFLASDWHPSQNLIWLKEQMVFSMGVDFHRVFEPCLFGWKKGEKHYLNKNYSNATDIVFLEREDFLECLDVWYEHRDTTSEYVHPTQKPVRLAERALRKSTKIGDIVIDAFGGSGSTLVACEQMGRKCRTIEMDPKYCAVIIERWEKLTSEKAQKING